MPQSIDALLAAAKQTLGNADTLEHQTWDAADLASRMPSAPATSAPSSYAPASDGSLFGNLTSAAGASYLPTDIGDRFADTVDPTATRDADALVGTYGWGDRLKSFFAGAGKGFLDQLREASTPLGAGMIAAGGEGGAAKTIGRVASGVLGLEGASQAADSSGTLGSRVQGGANALLGLLGVKGGYLPEEEAAAEPAIAPRKFAPARTPEPLSNVPLPRTPVRVSSDLSPYGYGGIAEGRQPLAGDLAAPESSVDRYMPNTGATPPPSGDFTWDMSDFADQPEGSVVKHFTLDDGGSTVEAPAAHPSALSKLFKPRIGAAEAAHNLRDSGSVLGDVGDLSRTSVYPEDEADATHRLGFYLEDKSLNTQWKQLLAQFKENQARGGGDVPPSEPSGPAPAPTSPEPTVRLYRGESDSAQPGPLAGQTFTDNPLDAMYYAKQGGGAGRTYYMDLPASQAAQFRTVDPTGQGVHILPPEMAAQARNNILGADPNASTSIIRPAAPSSLKEMLDASLAKQEADRTAASAPSRTGHFTLPEAHVPDEAYVAAARRLGVDPSRVAPEAVSRPLAGASDLSMPAAPSRLREFLANEQGSVAPANLVPDEATREKLGALAQAHQAGSLLMSPLTVGRIAVSNTAAALQKAAEVAANEGSFAPMGRTLKELLNVRQMGRDAIDAFRNPDEMSRLGAEGRPHGIFGVATRAVGAVDRPFRNAMERAGFSPEDALSVTQQRTPLTATGKHLLRSQQGSALTRLAIPFAKSGINLFEQGVVEPAQAAGRVLTGDARPSDFVKIGSAAGSTIAGYAADKALKKSGAPNWLKRLAFAASGLYEVPATLAQAAAEATNTDSVTGQPDYLGRAFTAAQKGASNLPVVGPGLAGLFDPRQLTRRIVPRGLNPDYYTGTTRDTHNTRQKIQAQIPGLAQLLRVKRSARAARSPR